MDGANLSGAGFKIWEVIKSGVRGDASEKKATAAAKKGKMKVESEVEVETASETAEESEPEERRSRTLKRVEIDIAEVIDAEEKEEKVYVPILKKRRIQPQSDEEE